MVGILPLSSCPGYMEHSYNYRAETSPLQHLIEAGDLLVSEVGVHFQYAIPTSSIQRDASADSETYTPIT